jgi:prepilin-type N-terminal cleavage/methylation domain-containing protein
MRNRTLPPVRRGYTIMEMVVAMAMVAGLIASVGQLALLALSFERSSEAQRQTGQVAGNLLEHLTSLPAKELTAERAAAEAIAARQSDLQVAATVREATSADSASPLHTQQIEVVVIHDRYPAARTRLLGWKHARSSQP